MQASNNTTADILNKEESLGIHPDAIAKYINVLTCMFIIEEAPAWSRSLSASDTASISNTRYLANPRLVAAAMHMNWPDDLLDDPKTFGFVFETMAMRDLRVYSESLQGTVYHYRSYDKLECDAVIQIAGGAYGLVEIKLGSHKGIEHGAVTLRRIGDRIRRRGSRKPSFLMILTGMTPYAYKREAGILIVLIDCLHD